METAIGVFASRDRAEEAVKELRGHGIPEQSIIFLTRSESEAKTVAKQFGEVVGGFMGGAAGMSAGVLAATLLLPGIGTVFALGFGGAALLGLAGAGAGGSVGTAAVRDQESTNPTPDDKCAEDVQFFREVLKEGRSLIVVRTESNHEAATACGILDRLGIGMQGKAPVKMEAVTRESGDIGIIDVSGRITVGEGNVRLRQAVDELVEKGYAKVLINLAEVNYIDSSGLGELVKTHTTIRNRGGYLKLVAVNKRVYDLLRVTKLSAVFDIEAEEEKAISAFNGLGSSAVA